MRDSAGNRDGGTMSNGGGGDSTSGGGTAKPPPKVPPIGSVCGDGILGDGELCDGKEFRKDVQTCQQALMNGGLWFGTLKCTADCALDTSACIRQGDGGSPNTRPPTGGGGMIGIGGFGAIGGSGGSFGFPSSPANECYSRGDVPDPASPDGCSFGVDAVNACFGKPNRTTCVDKCACSNCASFWDRCQSDGACFWVWGCLANNGCSSVSSCPACSSAIDTAGGSMTPSAALMNQVLTCLAKNNCPLGC